MSFKLLEINYLARRRDLNIEWTSLKKMVNKSPDRLEKIIMNTLLKTIEKLMIEVFKLQEEYIKRQIEDKQRSQIHKMQKTINILIKQKEELIRLRLTSLNSCETQEIETKLDNDAELANLVEDLKVEDD